MTSPSDPRSADAALLLPLSSLAHLFHAPPISPLSSSPPEVLGISGIDYLLPLLQMERKTRRARMLVITLPPDQARTADVHATMQALQQFALAHLARDAHELRNTRRHGWRITGIALVCLAFCIALSSLFASHYTEFLRPIIRHTFEYGFEIVGWVLLWNPIDMLVFSPLPIRYRMAALRTLASMHVEIRAEAEPAAALRAPPIAAA